MRVFVTGASGHIGSAVVSELREAGHQVVGLARSDQSAAALEALGATALRGTLDELDTLSQACTGADGVIHLAFKHELLLSGEYATAVESDLTATQTMGEALAGSGKPFVTTSGTLMLAFAGISGRAGTEEDAVEAGPRATAENYVVALGQRGVRSSVVRLPPLVHSYLDHHGFGPTLIGLAREHGVAGYAGDGSNRWPAVHTLDAAHAYRLALEAGAAGSRFHAVADEGVPFREIAETIGRRLGVPAASIATDDLADHFSFLAGFVGADNPTSSRITRAALSWLPENVGLIDDLELDHYFRS